MLSDVYRTGQTLPQTNHLTHTHTHAQLIKDVGRPINILTGTELAGRRGRLNEQPCLSVCVCVCVCVCACTNMNIHPNGHGHWTE